jgi:hypothetical protein
MVPPAVMVSFSDSSRTWGVNAPWSRVVLLDILFLSLLGAELGFFGLGFLCLHLRAHAFGLMAE